LRCIAYLHQLRGTPESHHAHEHAALHPITNAFSKKVENHAAAVALHYMYYNFCRVHQTLRVPPVMEARVTDHVWNLEEVVGLLDTEAKRAAA